MFACGEHSRAVHRATYHSRARLPTPPHSYGKLKDISTFEELSNHSGRSHENLNSNLTPVLLPPGSVKTSIDLHTKSSLKPLSNDGQSVLDHVKAFIEAKPGEPLVTNNATSALEQHY